MSDGESRWARVLRAVRERDWPAYFDARRAIHTEETAPPQGPPPPSRTTRDPWPDGLDVPGGAAAAVKKLTAAQCDVSVRYARGWRPARGAGQYVEHHYVVVAARSPIGRVGWARWRKAVSESEPVPGSTGWTLDAATVQMWPVESLGKMMENLTQ
jgi:hypothetical protein